MKDNCNNFRIALINYVKPQLYTSNFLSHSIFFKLIFLPLLKILGT